jgi:uncharacterized protein (TIGR03435 family)
LRQPGFAGGYAQGADVRWFHHLNINASLLLASTVAVFAQGQSPDPLGFEVATVKPTASTDGRALLQATPGRLVMTNLALRRMILIAYEVQDYQIAGAPGWIDSEHYDIQAKAESNPSVQQMEGPMLRRLLEERFSLAIHRETRQLPVYMLSVGKTGPELQPSKEGSCTPYATNSPPPIKAQGEPRPVFCGFQRTPTEGLNRTLDAKGVTMAALATNLSRTYTAALGRNVIDGTGLTGIFDFHLTWAMDPPAAVPGAAGNMSPLESTGPSIFVALQEQLGLRLESTKGPVEVIVIDHIQKPSGN